MKDFIVKCFEVILFLFLLPFVLLCIGIGGLLICLARIFGVHRRLFGRNVVLVDVINGIVANARIVPDWAYLILVVVVMICFVCLVLPFVILGNGFLMLLIQRPFQVAKDVARVIGMPGERGY